MVAHRRSDWRAKGIYGIPKFTVHGKVRPGRPLIDPKLKRGKAQFSVAPDTEATFKRVARELKLEHAGILLDEIAGPLERVARILSQASDRLGTDGVATLVEEVAKRLEMLMN